MSLALCLVMLQGASLCSFVYGGSTEQGLKDIIKYTEIPDLSGKAYVKLQVHNPSGFVSRSYGNLVNNLQLKGSAWLLHENKDGSTDFIMQDGLTVSVVKSDYGYSEEPKPGFAYGTWTKVNFTDDLSRLKKIFKTQISVEGNDEVLSGANRRDGSDPATVLQGMSWQLEQGRGGDLINFAAILYKLAETPTQRAFAVDMAQTCLNKSGGITKGLKSFSSHRLDVETYMALDKALQSNNWDQYLKDLKHAYDRFGRGAKERDIYQQLIKHLDEPKSVKADPGWSKEQKRFFELIKNENELLSLKNEGLVGSHRYSYTGQQEKNNSELITLFKKKRMDMIPVLIKLKEDYTFLPFNNTSLFNSGYSGYYGSGGKMTQEEEIQFWRAMNRPVFVRDVSLKMLQIVVPNGESLYQDFGATDLTSIAEHMYHQYKQSGESGEVTTIKNSLKSGDNESISEAIELLVELQDDELYTYFENYMLTGTMDAYAFWSNVMQYIQLRGDEGKGFAKKVEEAAKNKSLNYNKEYEDAESLTDQLETLAFYTSSKKLEDYLIKIHEDDETWAKAERMVHRFMESAKLNKDVLASLLETLQGLDLKDEKYLKRTVQLVGWLYRIEYSLQYQSMDNDSHEAKLDINQYKGLFIKLLSLDPKTQHEIQVDVTLAFLMESFIERVTFAEIMKVQGISTLRFNDWLIQRQFKRLEGEEVLDFKTYWQVSDESRQGLKDEFHKKEIDALYNWLSKMDMKSLYVLGNLHQAGELSLPEGADLKAYLSLSNIIREIELPEDYHLKEQLKKLKGKEFNKKTHEEIKKHLFKYARQNDSHVVMLVLYRLKLYQGTNIKAYLSITGGNEGDMTQQDWGHYLFQRMNQYVSSESDLVIAEYYNRNGSGRNQVAGIEFAEEGEFAEGINGDEYSMQAFLKELTSNWLNEDNSMNSEQLVISNMSSSAFQFYKDDLEKDNNQ